MSPKRIDTQVKKQDILRAAIKVITEKGVANTKMADVAETAGIGKGTLYEYFKNKEDIFKEAFRYYMEQMDGIMAKRLYKVHDPIEKIKTLISAWTEAIQEPSIACTEIMIDVWAEGVRNRQLAKAFDLKQTYEEYRTLVMEILEDGILKGRIRSVNTTIVASIIIGAMDGLALQWFLDRNLFKLNEMEDVLTDSIIEMLKKI